MPSFVPCLHLLLGAGDHAYNASQPPSLPARPPGSLWEGIKRPRYKPRYPRKVYGFTGLRGLLRRARFYICINAPEGRQHGTQQGTCTHVPRGTYASVRTQIPTNTHKHTAQPDTHKRTAHVVAAPSSESFSTAFEALAAVCIHHAKDSSL